MSNDEDNGLNEQLRNAIVEFTKWWNEQLSKQERAQKVETPLYHYTDANGLAGIIKNQKIWFTSMFHLNDPSELKYGLEIAAELLNDARDSDNDAVKLFVKTMLSGIPKFATEYFGYYVASFSRDSNDLGQWRAYADNGRGYALGLAPQLFQRESKDDAAPNQIFFVAEVDYCRKNVKQLLREPIGRAVQIAANAKTDRLKTSDQSVDFFVEMQIALATPIFWYAMTTKHEAYRHEQETRLLIIDDREKLKDDIKIRTRGSNIVPFIPVSMPVKEAGSITEIVIGPSADSDAEDAIRTLLLSEQLGREIPIRRSGIPYRVQ